MMSSVLRLVPIVLLCVVLMAPTPVRSTSIVQWFMFAFNFIRTLFYYLIPVKRHQMRAIDDTLTGLKDILHDIMPEEGRLRNLEKPNFTYNGYLCLGQGTARNFKTLVKQGSVTCTWESDNTVNVEIPYHLEEFHVTFGKFFLKMVGMKKTGSIQMDMAQNTVIVGIQIPNVMDMIGKLTSDEDCLIYITKFDIVTLMGVKVTVHSDGLTHGTMTGQLMTTYFSAHPTFLKKAVRESFLGNMHMKLADKSKTVCISPSLAEEMHRLGVDKARVYSPAFEQFCGGGATNNDLQHDENKKPEDELHHSSVTHFFTRKTRPKPGTEAR